MKTAIALAQLVGSRNFYRLIARQSPDAVFGLSAEELVRDYGLKGSTARKIAAFDAWDLIDQQLEIADKTGTRIMFWHQDDHPRHVMNSDALPPVLYLRGTPMASLWGEGIALVGSRTPNAYGMHIAFALAEAAARRGIPVVSGLALGVDAEAHRGALSADGVTWAVLGSGVDQPYPWENEGLFRSIIDNGGAVLSFFPMGTPPLSINFPLRNELIALLARTTVVVQATAKSGARHTATYARTHKRGLYAVPGHISDRLQEGCHQLIRQGAEALWDIDEFFDRWQGLTGVTPGKARREQQPHTADVLPFPPMESGVAPAPAPPEAASEPETPLSPEAQTLLASIPPRPVHADDIAQRSNIPPQHLMSLLMDLVLAGWVEQQPGNYYCRIRSVKPAVTTNETSE